MSKYAILQNKEGKTLVFYPCPKNGNSSVKLFIAKHLGVDSNFLFLSDKIPQVDQKDEDFMGKKNLIRFLPSKQRFHKVIADYKCCIIRNPVERFVSAYKNRILFHKDKQFQNHNIDQILNKLEKNLFENKHFLPQSYFLGNNLNYYDFYCDLKNIKIFEKKVNEFFGNTIEFPKIQTGGNKISINLDNNQLQRIKAIYSKDYVFLNNFKEV